MPSRLAAIRGRPDASLFVLLAFLFEFYQDSWQLTQ